MEVENTLSVCTSNSGYCPKCKKICEPCSKYKCHCGHLIDLHLKYSPHQLSQLTGESYDDNVWGFPVLQGKECIQAGTGTSSAHDTSSKTKTDKKYGKEIAVKGIAVKEIAVDGHGYNVTETNLQ